MAVTPLLRICQFTAFFIAVSANTVLLYLIKVRAGSSFGSYRVLMVSFSVYAIIYAVIEILTMPVLHIHKSGVLFYVDSTLSEYRSTRVLSLLRIIRIVYLHVGHSFHFSIRRCLQIRDEQNRRVFQFFDLLGAFISCIIMTVCLTTCVICAFKTYKKLNDMTIQMSERTRNLNKQLFWTLGLQTLLPFVTQYIPVGTMFLLPFFEINFGRIGNIVGAACSLYPAMDPIIAIFMIDKFRNFILRREGTMITSKVSTFNDDGKSTRGEEII